MHVVFTNPLKVTSVSLLPSPKNHWYIDLTVSLSSILSLHSLSLHSLSLSPLWSTDLLTLWPSSLVPTQPHRRTSPTKPRQRKSVV